jgi:hypothetical protein
MAMTKDIKVVDHMYLQYATSSGCDHPNACNRKFYTCRLNLQGVHNFGMQIHLNVPPHRSAAGIFR